MTYRIFIDGAEGTTGLKIHDYFKKRGDIEVLAIDENKRKDVDERLKMIEAAHVSFLCLPDGAAREIVPLIPKEARILDTSTAHRTNKEWTYGLPELNKNRRGEIKESRRVAVPGCHATGMILLIAPLIDKGVINSSFPLTGVSITGYSGGGKKMIRVYEESLGFSPGIYGLTQRHKHLKEIMAMTGLTEPPAFHPVVGDYFSGMAVSLYFHRNQLAGIEGKETILELFQRQYQGEAFIHVEEVPEEQTYIYADSMAGRNDLRIEIGGNDDVISLTALYDNLGKGASGAAVQNMNIMLGIEETCGLIK